MPGIAEELKKEGLLSDNKPVLIMKQSLELVWKRHTGEELKLLLWSLGPQELMGDRQVCKKGCFRDRKSDWLSKEEKDQRAGKKVICI